LQGREGPDRKAEEGELFRMLEQAIDDVLMPHERNVLVVTRGASCATV
jgi:hypothetical protein